MRRIPSLKAREVVGILKRLGFQEDRQSGGHLILFNPKNKKRIVIPVHAGRDIKKSLLAKIIKEDLEMTIEKFLEFR